MLFDRQLYRAAQRQLMAYRPQNSPHQLHLQRENASALLFDDLDSRMLVIAGSNDWQDWQQNLTACPVGLWREHAGIWRHAELLAREIRDMQLQFGDKPLDIVGHSLGGAVAIALPLHLPGLNPRNIITFGSPAVFKGAAPAASYHYPVTRVVFEYDLVPDLPMQLGRWMFGNWRHPQTATVRQYTFGGEEVPGRGLWRECSRRARRAYEFADSVMERVLVRRRRWCDARNWIVTQWHSPERYAKLFAPPVVSE